MNKSSALNLIVACWLLFVMPTSARADDTLGQQPVFKAVDGLYSTQQDVKEILPINVEILSLKTLSEHDRVSAQAKVLKFQELDLTLNQAELYILHLIRANIADIEGQEHKVVNWLNKAIKLEPSLAKRQSNSPLFARAYLMPVSYTHLTLPTIYSV